MNSQTHFCLGESAVSIGDFWERSGNRSGGKDGRVILRCGDRTPSFLRVLRGELVMSSEARYVLLGKFDLHDMFTNFVNSIGSIHNTCSKGFLNLHQPVLKLLDAASELSHGILRT